MLKLKQEYKDFIKAHKEEIMTYDSKFLDNHSYYLEHRLPKSWQERINNLWWKSPLSKIHHGWTNYAMVRFEMADLKNDHICRGNLNKEYWIKAYMMNWLTNLPEVATAEYLMNNMDSRKAWIVMLKNAYEKDGK